MVMLSPGCCLCTCDIDFWARLSGCMGGLRDILVEFVDPDDPDMVFWGGNTIPTGEVIGTIEDIPVPGRKFKMRVTLSDLGKDRFVDPSHGVALYCGKMNLIDYIGNGTNLVPADGYHCLPLFWGASTGHFGDPPLPGTSTTDCIYPIPDVLQLTDSAYGPCPLTYGTNGFLSGWSGWHRVDYPGNLGFGNCPPASMRIGYYLGVYQQAFMDAVLLTVWTSYAGGESACPGDISGRDGFPVNGRPIGATLIIASCLPFDATATISRYAWGNIYPDGSTITITERPAA
jgi:hypothetical protein